MLTNLNSYQKFIQSYSFIQINYMNYIELEQNFMTTIKSSVLQEELLDLADHGLDELLDSGLLSGLPVVNFLHSTIKTVNSVSDYLFMKKIIAFLLPQSTVHAEQRIDIIESLEKDPHYKNKVGTKLLYILEKCEDHSTAKIIGLWFTVYLKKEISLSIFHHGANIITSCFQDDFIRFIKSPIDLLEKEGDVETIPNDVDFPLISVGLIGFGFNHPRLEHLYDELIEEGEEYIRGTGTTYITHIGKLLRTHLNI